MELKKKLSNVAFGGGWSEEILTNDMRDEIALALRHVIEECRERDMRDDKLDVALGYIRAHIEKGDALSDALLKALSIDNQNQRHTEAQKAIHRILNWLN